jgi:hypothetical protein
MWWPGHIEAGKQFGETMSHIDCWSTLATMAGITPPPHGEWKDNNGKPIYFDSIDNSAYILRKADHSARKSWIYIDGEVFQGARVDIGGDTQEPWVNIAWKYLYTAKDSWLGSEANLGGNRRGVQPHHGSIRKVRYDLQWGGTDSNAYDIPGQVCRSRQWLGAVVDRTCDPGFRQVDHEVSQHQAIPWRCLERLEARSTTS